MVIKMGAFKKQDGFTLVEVIVAVVILLIIAMAFVPLFSTGTINIFSFGHRDKAMALGSEKMEIFYANQPLDNGKIDEIIDTLSGNYVIDSNDLHTYQGNGYNFSTEESFMPIEYESDVSGYKVTIVVFYQNGEKHVTVVSFVRGAP